MNKHYQTIIPLTILFLWLALPLTAQPPCITFDNLEKGRTFSLLSASPADQVIVKEPWVIARLRSFTSPTTATGHKAVVVDPDSLDGDFPKGKSGRSKCSAPTWNLISALAAPPSDRYALISSPWRA
ncbi:MAG: hypothetical protein IPK21_08375 [Haliscomenobacter sp.]|nr:hypothetical protein [Haliscomenobacter sp.]